MKPDYLNDDEPGNLPPGFSKMEKVNPFKVPDGYFDSLPDDIMKKIDALPDLDRMNKENPFNVPDGYFDSLPAAVQQRIISENVNRRFSGEWIAAVFRPKLLAAAIVVVFLIFGIRYITRPIVLSESSPKYLSYEDVQNSSCVGDIDESDFIDLLEVEQNKNASVIEESGIEQYLLDNNVDISQLENRL